MPPSSNTPQVSVILPLFSGHVDFLDEAIESLLEQDLLDIEVLIVMRSTTREILNLVRAYAKKDPRLKAIQNTNTTSLAQNINDAAEKSPSPFLALMHPDDIALPDRLSKQVNALKKQPSAVACGAQIQTINANNQIQKTYHYPKSKTASKKRIRLMPGLSYRALMIRTSVFNALGGMDGQFEHLDPLFNELIMRTTTLYTVINSDRVLQFQRDLQEPIDKNAIPIIHEYLVAVAKIITPQLVSTTITPDALFDRKNPLKLAPKTREAFALCCLVYCFQYLEQAHRERLFRIAMQLLNRQTKCYHRYLWGYLYIEWIKFAQNTGDASLYVQSVFGLLLHNPILLFEKVQLVIEKLIRRLKT